MISLKSNIPPPVKTFEYISIIIEYISIIIEYISIIIHNVIIMQHHIQNMAIERAIINLLI